MQGSTQLTICENGVTPHSLDSFWGCASGAKPQES